MPRVAFGLRIKPDARKNARPEAGLALSAVKVLWLENKLAAELHDTSRPTSGYHAVV
jgi:hypothetical protein